MRRSKIYEGRGKILYEWSEAGTLVQHFKDDAQCSSGTALPPIEGKGVLNNRLSEYFMRGLDHIGVPHHLLRRLNMREQLIRGCDMIPLEIRVRSFAGEDLAQRLGLELGARLPRPMIEFCYKNGDLNYPLVPEEYVMAFGWATQQDLDDMVALALRVNDYMTGVTFSIGLKLIDLRLEMGRIYEGDFQRIILADEISPDTCTLWDMETNQNLAQAAKDNPSHAYNEMARRLGVLPARGPQVLSPKIIN